MNLDVYESRRLPRIAFAATLALAAAFTGAAVSRRHVGLWAGSAVSILVALTAGSAAFRTPRRTMTLGEQGLTVYRRWRDTPGTTYRDYVEPGESFPWSMFGSVTLHERTARFTGYTREYVLRLKTRQGRQTDRSWSHDDDDPDFLVQASEQDVSKERLLELFDRAIRRGRLDTSELTR